MKVYEIKQGSTSLEGLRQAERPEPQPGPRQVLVRVHAASLNFRDQAVIAGRYFGGPVSRNLIPLSDGAGEVASLGPGVTRFKTGDRVAGTFFQVWIDGPPSGLTPALGSPLDGMLAEYVAVSEDGLVALPASLSYEEGATLPCAGVTAWNALMVSGRRVKPGDSVLCLGTGGVSIFALQFARAVDARVIITSSSDQKIERALGLGAFAGVNYKRHTDWEQEVQKLTGGRGVDHVIEVGGVGTLSRSFQAVAFAGKVALIGVLAGPTGDANPLSLMIKSGSLQGIFVGNRRMFEEMNAAIEVNKIRPIIEKVFPFEQAAEAYRFQQSGQFIGKIVIQVSGAL